jgi:hypothetical protein
MSRVIIEATENGHLLATTMQEAIEHERRLLRHNLDQAREELVSFEERFDQPSSTFFAKYEQGLLDETDDYIDWAGTYRIFLKLQQKLSELEKVEIIA